MNLTKKGILISSYIKFFFRNGKQAKIENVFKLTVCYIKQIEKRKTVFLLIDFIKKARPFCEVKSLKIRGNMQNLPITIKQNRQKSLALRNLAANITNKNNVIVETFTNEFVETVVLQGKTIKACNLFHKNAESNKIFIYFKT